MSLMRFLLVGGFLGAGKTTTIARLAKSYCEQGLKVGIVTNDQAGDLVDTHSLRAAGFDVGEVAGSCFCCNFNGLAQVVSELEEHAHPDIILAEPVGSCTDIVATVIQPLRHLHQGKFRVSPYGVILKPSHGKKILGNLPKAGFSPKAAYIFRKQLEEADFLIINRIDELDATEIQELAHLLATEYPGVPQVRISAKTGDGFAALEELLDQDGEFGRRILELDYDIYAEGEAELGWLNSRLNLKASQPVAMDELALRIVRRLQETFRACDAEPAHLKTIVMAPDACAVANLVRSDSPAVLSRAADKQFTDVDVIVNARVAIDPEELARQVESTVRTVCRELGGEALFQQTQSFRPGRPNPTYRYADAV